MDEKAMVGLNALANSGKLDRAFKKQVAKRMDAGVPSGDRIAVHMDALAQVAANDGFGIDDFLVAWDKYYPTIVSLLGFASWFMPASAINVIKALLAVVNNQIIPLFRK